jgi:hypothetical protein
MKIFSTLFAIGFSFQAHAVLFGAAAAASATVSHHNSQARHLQAAQEQILDWMKAQPEFCEAHLAASPKPFELLSSNYQERKTALAGLASEPPAFDQPMRIVMETYISLRIHAAETFGYLASQSAWPEGFKDYVRLNFPELQNVSADNLEAMKADIETQIAVTAREMNQARRDMDHNSYRAGSRYQNDHNYSDLRRYDDAERKFRNSSRQLEELQERRWAAALTLELRRRP